MKKVLLTIAVVSVAASVLAQGTINYINRNASFSALIYGPEAGALATAKAGNTTAGVPAGTQVYTGALLEGARYAAQFFAAPTGGAAESALQGATTVNTFRTGAQAGQMAVTIATFNNIASAQATPGTLQLRVWDNQSGQYPTWAEAEVAWQKGLIAAGKSALFDQASFGGGTVLPTAPIGLRSFNIYFVPEPSTMALAGLGAAAMLIFRRRK